MSAEKSRILILCVDRDNDVGVKTGVKAPIIGRDRNLEVASLLAVKDPEESDSNAIFGAVKTYDSLSTESGDEDYQVATITGSELGGVKADKQSRDQLIEVLSGFPADNVVLVTDGFSDQEVIPLVQSRVPIMSIRRVVVRHSEAIEESWALFYRYLKRLVEDPYYARWALGVPGILFIILSLLWYFDQLLHAGMFFLLFIGGVFLVKGFNLDKKFIELVFPSPPNLIRLFTTVIAFIIIGLDLYLTYGNLIDSIGDPALWTAMLPKVVGHILESATDLMVTAGCIFIIGLGIYFYFMRDSRIWWTLVGVVATIWMRQIALTASVILLLPITPPPSEYIQSLIIVIGLGISTTVAVILITMKLSRIYGRYFRRSESERED